VLNYWGIANTVYVNVEQRQERTNNLCVRLVDRMEQTEGYYYGIPTIIEGAPQDAYELSSWLPDKLYDIPGSSGDFYLTASSQFYYAIRSYTGAPLNLVYDPETKERIKATDEYQNMKAWPDKDSVKIINDIMVINFVD